MLCLSRCPSALDEAPANVRKREGASLPIVNNESRDFFYRKRHGVSKRASSRRVYRWRSSEEKADESLPSMAAD